MPSETVSEGIAFVPPFLHHGQCGPVDSSPRFSSPKKDGFSAINRHGGKPVAIPVPTSPPCLSPQAEKSGRQFVPLFLSEKKRRFRNQRGTAANPLQYPSRLLLRASPRKPKNPVDSSSRFSSPKKNGVFRHQHGMTATNRCNTRSDFSSPSQSTAYLVSFKFLRPVFSKRRQRFFPFFNQTFFR